MTAERQHQLRVMEYAAKWATAELLSALMQHDELVAALERGASVDEVAAVGGLTVREAGGLLRALVVEDLLSRAEGTYVFSDAGRAALRYRGWLDLYVRGYRDLFHRADDVWRGGAGGCRRDMPAIGRASNAMSEYDAVPLVAAAVEAFRPGAGHVLDVGCADGIGVARLCELRSRLTGVGVEPDPVLAEAARARVRERGLDDRVQILCGDVARLAIPFDPDVVVFSFVLQELLGQTSRSATVDLLRTLGTRWPHAAFLVVEVDAAGRRDDERMRSDPQRRGYYNYYFLVHDLTAQQLLTFEEWRELFADAGFSVGYGATCDPAVDDTGLTAVFGMTFAASTADHPAALAAARR